MSWLAMKDGKKENPKPLVEKVAEAKPVDDAVGKIDDKKPPVVTETAPRAARRRSRRSRKRRSRIRRRRSRSKPENKPKEEPKPIEKKPDPVKPDPIAEAIKKEEKKPPPKPVHRPPSRRRAAEAEGSSNGTSIRARSQPCSTSATRRASAVTGDTLNSNAALGTSKGTAADNSATWGAMFKQQVERCWKKPYGGIESQQTEAVVCDQA